MPTRPPVHRPHGQRTREQYARDYDKYRGSSASRGYDHQWRKIREEHLSREPMCRHCVQQGKFVPATVCDHIVPFKGDSVLFADPSNLQSLCASCHAKKDRGIGGGIHKLER